jgi:EAL domain-containing protein (putative c-di-GMP-specific phosphodiesterase class I)
MTTVVEGVEGEVELEYIKECGADKYQGYYCSPAVEKEKFISLLNQPSAH